MIKANSHITDIIKVKEISCSNFISSGLLAVRAENSPGRLPWISRAEAGKVFLVRGHWINAFLDECQIFTGHGDKYDDQIDAVSGCYQILEIYPKFEYHSIAKRRFSFRGAY